MQQDKKLQVDQSLDQDIKEALTLYFAKNIAHL